MSGSMELPLLLSLQAQATLGLMKDTRTGKCWVKDYDSELKLHEVEGSGLRAICISDVELVAQVASAEAR